MTTANEIARFIINLFKDEEEGISNMKLQKLLYYAQGMSYKLTGEPLFSDDIEAWENGPVIYDVWKQYTHYGREAIRESSDISFDENICRLLLDVALQYGKYTTAALVSMTHAKGSPWDKSYVPGETRTVIPPELIKAYFAKVEKAMPIVDIESKYSSDDYTVISSDTIIPLEEWDYE